MEASLTERETAKKACIAFFVFFVIYVAAYCSYFTFMYDIGQSHGAQETFIIDAHYYLWLGEFLSENDFVGSGSVWGDVKEVAPTSSSRGIVFYSYFLNKLSFAKDLVPLSIMAIFFVVALRFFSCYGAIGFRPVAYLFVGGVFPYIYLPSKESLFLLGLLLLFSFRSVGLVVGLVLMCTARPEALMIFIFAVFCKKTFDARWSTCLFLLAAVVAYSVFFREYIYGISVLFQEHSRTQGNMFCFVYGIPVCHSGIGSFELVSITRLATAIFLPLDWVLDFFGVLVIAESITASKLIIRFSLMLSSIVFAYAFLMRKMVLGSVGFWFALIYFSLYASVFYYQSSRPLLFALMVWLVVDSILAFKRQNKRACLKFGKPERIFGLRNGLDS